MNYLARAVTAAVVIAFLKLFLGRRRRKRSSNHSNDDTSSLQSDSTPDSVDSDSMPLPIGEYEVFLNFRGPDARDSITKILHRFLIRSKIRTFMDDDELRKGEGIWSNLVKAIGQIFVPIFSPRYAESKWCHKELAEIVELKKRENGHIILPIFYMVDPRDVRHQIGPYEVAFKQHNGNGFDEETIQCWKAALTEVGSLKGWHIKTKEEEVDVVDVVYGVVWSHLSKNNSELETDDLVGIDDQVKQVVDMLDLDSQGVKIVGLHGWTQLDQLLKQRESYELLLKNKGTDKIKAIKLDINDHVILESNCFTNLTELRYFWVNGAKFVGDFNHLIPNLKWMQFNTSASCEIEGAFNLKSLIILVTSGTEYDFTYIQDQRNLAINEFGRRK
ncbi:Disease resistance protein L6 [Linum perenne]